MFQVQLITSPASPNFLFLLPLLSCCWQHSLPFISHLTDQQAQCILPLQCISQPCSLLHPYHNSLPIITATQWVLPLGESLHKATRGPFLKCKSGHVTLQLKVFSASLLSTRESLGSSACHSRHDSIWPQSHFPTSFATPYKAPTL